MDADFLLIHKMKNGDEEAIEVFVKKYYSTIRNYCRLHTYTDCDAEDITQATFEHFFRSFRSYHHVGKTANYLYVIARNLCRDSYKKKRDIVMEELPDKGENPIAVIENKIDIEESIKKLPEDLQEVVILHYFQDLKLKEVADIIGIGLPLVKYRIGKAKVVPFILIFLPSFLSGTSLPLLNKILGLLPDQMLQMNQVVKFFNLYEIGGKVFCAVPILIISYSILLLLIVPVIYFIYRRKEVYN